jgi:hypothetical protein
MGWLYVLVEQLVVLSQWDEGTGRRWMERGVVPQRAEFVLLVFVVFSGGHVGKFWKEQKLE